MTSPTRILAHSIIYQGIRHHLSIADIRRDTQDNWSVTITPFAGETAGTSFHSGTVEIRPSSSPATPPTITLY